MQVGIERGPAVLRQWIEENSVDPSAVARVVEGVELSARGETPESASGHRPTVYIPSLSTRPWWDPADFGWVPDMRGAATEILAEFGNISASARGGRVSQSTELADEGRWTTLYLYCAGRAYPQHLKACPKTVGALDRIPGATKAAGGMTYFSIMDPGTHVAAHTGYTNAHLRCHLGLVTPAGCRLRVGSESREWSWGEVSIFDDSFEHEAWNGADSRRVVLLFDIWHPELSKLERRAIAHLMAMWSRLQARDALTRELLKS
jgi:hypothetical protein